MNQAPSHLPRYLGNTMLAGRMLLGEGISTESTYARRRGQWLSECPEEKICIYKTRWETVHVDINDAMATIDHGDSEKTMTASLHMKSYRRSNMSEAKISKANDAGNEDKEWFFSGEIEAKAGPITVMARFDTAYDSYQVMTKLDDMQFGDIKLSDVSGIVNSASVCEEDPKAYAGQYTGTMTIDGINDFHASARVNTYCDEHPDFIMDISANITKLKLARGKITLQGSVDMSKDKNKDEWTFKAMGSLSLDELPSFLTSGGESDVLINVDIDAKGKDVKEALDEAVANVDVRMSVSITDRLTLDGTFEGPVPCHAGKKWTGTDMTLTWIDRDDGMGALNEISTEMSYFCQSAHGEMVSTFAT